MRPLLSRWQSFERGWRTDWIFAGFAAITVVSFSAIALARVRLNAALVRGERCLALADGACVSQAAEQARELAPAHPRSRFLAAGAQLLRGERQAAENILRQAEGEQLDARSQGERLLVLGDVEARKAHPVRAREHYRAAGPLVNDELQLIDRIARLDRAEREAREKRVAESQRWRADFERLFEAVEQGQQELINARSSDLQRRVWETPGAERELRSILTSVTQISMRREALRGREPSYARSEPPSRPPRGASEERAWREAQEARERESERQRQQRAAMESAVAETLARAREQLAVALGRLEAPPPEAP